MSAPDAGLRGGDVLADAAGAGAEVVQDIERWSTRTPSAEALPFLLSARAQAAVGALHGMPGNRFETASRLHRTALDRHLSPILLGAVGGRPVSAVELGELAAATRDDPIQSAFAPVGGADFPRPAALDRICLVKSLWPPFAEWWRSYFADRTDASPPMTDLWRLYLPLGLWVLAEKRRRRPGELFVMGFNGSPGAGKTVLTHALAVVLNQLLDGESEGQAVARSGDDWYLGRTERDLLRKQGYDPGLPGVSNRGLPGTHDLDWLSRNLLEMERSTHRSTIRMGNFDKQADDQPTGADRYVEVRGKVGVFLFDLWFAGAKADVDPIALPDGLQRRVAENLRRWRTVFDRMDALWGFNWPSFDDMVREREAQERLAEQRRGRRGMSPEHIRTFMAYMIERAWDWRTTSPIPPEEAITFRAVRDTSHRVIAVHRGGRAA